jgi:tetratricopeptide (TPR) repeat protein
VRLHREAKCLDDAERLQGVRVDWNRKSAALALAKPPRDLDAAERSSVLSLVALLLELVDIQRERGSAGCVEGFREALSLAEGFDTAQLSPALAFNLGRGYEGLDAIRDLAQAERWYGQSLDLCAKEDRLGRARCLIQLGNVAYRRAGDAAKATRAPEFVGQLENAERYTKKALELLPGSAIEDLRAAHYQMGLICSLAGQSVSALHHFQEAIRHCEMMQDRFKAGRARSGAARALAVARRFAEAREWAQAALRDFQASENADQDVVETLRLLQKIESDPRETSPPS